MTYRKGYYEQNKKKIADYNKARRENNPEVIAKEKESYQSKAEDYKLRSKIQHLRGRMAWDMLSKKKKESILADISEKLGIEIK
tara:strand:- start:1340 stop:1591 length:252 start_codon:yes stop_codon:yes gene_type:complete